MSEPQLQEPMSHKHASTHTQDRKILEGHSETLLRASPNQEAGPAAPFKHSPSFMPPVFSFRVVPTTASRELQENRETQSKLTAVVAPIGYGKTVLLSNLYHECLKWDLSSWWFNLDDRDVTAERLLDDLEGKLETRGASKLKQEIDPTSAMHQGSCSESERIHELVACLREWPKPLVLVIDNLNYCHDAALAELLEQLVFNTPPRIKLVCSSTEALPINLVRCKLEGLLKQYGTAELSFNLQSIQEILGPALCSHLQPLSIKTIAHHTEGWPAAVRLMQILLSSSQDPEKTVKNLSILGQDVATLLNTQVLNGLAPTLRSFLLSLSHLRDFDAEMASIVTGDMQAQAHISYLWKHNIFLIPVDGFQRYRLHNLFREYLCTQAAKEVPEKNRHAILEKAALYCEREARCADAIDYALAAGLTNIAASILERTAPVFVRDLGYLRRYLNWISQLHAAGEHGGWEADYWYVWALVFRRRYGQAREEVERLTERLERSKDQGQGNARKLALLARRIEVIRIALAIYTDRLWEAHQHAGQWLKMSDLEGGLYADSPFDVSTAACALAIAHANDCRLMDARRSLRVAQASIEQSGSTYGQGWVAAVNGLVQLREGDYASAYRDLADAMTQAQKSLGNHAGIAGTIALLAAKAAVEMGMDKEASLLLSQGMLQISTHGIVDTAAYGLDAAVKLWPGYDTEALSLTALRRTAATYPPRLSLMLSCFLARRLIRLGRIDEAWQEAKVLGIDTEFDTALILTIQKEHGAALRDQVQATQAELLIAARHLKLTAKEITQEGARARTEGRSERLVELSLDEAFLSQCTTHSSAPAARYLTRAISLAARRRHLRPFRDRRDLIATLVNDTRLKDWPFVLEEERRFFVEICDGLKVGNPILDQMQKMDGAHLLAETPTTRELELLSLIEAGLSNQEIADRLMLSIATVKWHLYNLYAKLGAKNRASALARARSLNLLQW